MLLLLIATFSKDKVKSVKVHQKSPKKNSHTTTEREFVPKNTAEDHPPPTVKNTGEKLSMKTSSVGNVVPEPKIVPISQPQQQQQQCIEVREETFLPSI